VATLIPPQGPPVKSALAATPKHLTTRLQRVEALSAAYHPYCPKPIASAAYEVENVCRWDHCPQVLGAWVVGCSLLVGCAAPTLNPLVDYRYQGAVHRNANGGTARSQQVIAAFKKQWACPATGLHSGACPGWAIDNVIPLDCGGADAVWNCNGYRTRSSLPGVSFQRTISRGGCMVAAA
jgi:hypothetical protein